MTTADLVEHVANAPDVTERELALLDRLTGALDELDFLTRQLGAYATEAESDA